MRVNGNRLLHIPMSSMIGALPSDDNLSYPRHLLVGTGFITLQRCSQCILEPQAMMLIKNEKKKLETTMKGIT